MQIEKDKISPKDEFIAIVCAVCLGSFGAHHFYLGRWINGLIYLALKIFLLLNGRLFDLSDYIGIFGSFAASWLGAILFLILLVIDIFRLKNEAMTDGKGRLVCSTETLEENGISVDKYKRVNFAAVCGGALALRIIVRIALALS